MKTSFALGLIILISFTESSFAKDIPYGSEILRDLSLLWLLFFSLGIPSVALSLAYYFRTNHRIWESRDKRYPDPSLHQADGSWVRRVSERAPPLRPQDVLPSQTPSVSTPMELSAPAWRCATILASCAGISAVLSYFAWHYTLGTSILTLSAIPLLPGICFGLVMSLGIRLWVSRRAFKLIAMLLSTVIAWFSAVETQQHVNSLIGQMLREIAPPPPDTYFYTVNYMLAVSGVFGGFVGSAMLAFALAPLCKQFRNFDNWALIVMLGTALGILLELAPYDQKLPVHIGSLLPLFLSWQMTIAAVVGYGIAPRTKEPSEVAQTTKRPAQDYARL